MKSLAEMSESEYKEYIRQLLDDTLETIYYRSLMDMEDATTEYVKGKIEEVLHSMGYGQIGRAHV